MRKKTTPGGDGNPVGPKKKGDPPPHLKIGKIKKKGKRTPRTNHLPQQLDLRYRHQARWEELRGGEKIQKMGPSRPGVGRSTKRLQKTEEGGR